MKYLRFVSFGITLLTFNAAQAEEFHANGSISFTQTFYGNAGGYKTTTAHPSVVMNYQFSPKWSLDLEWDRTWNLYTYDGGPRQQDNDYSALSGTLKYDYGNIGSSKATWAASLKAKAANSFDGSKQAYFVAKSVFDFAEYAPSSKYIQSTQFALAPVYVYGKNTSGPSGSVNTAGLGFLTSWNLPANFSLTLNGYVFKDWYDGSYVIANNTRNYSDAAYFMLSAWLSYSDTVYKFNEKTSLDFNFTGGLDPYISSNRRASWGPYLIGSEMYEWLSPTIMSGNYKSTFTLFALPQLSLNHKFNDSFSANAFVQVKYSNQIWGEKEKSWEWQPQTGFNLTYNF